MRAVNLIPADQRTGGLTGGRSGGMVYAALGGLVVLLLAVSVYALAGRDAKQAEQELEQVQIATQQYQSAAEQYAAFEQAATQATARIKAVHDLAAARFDWAGAMRDLSRVIPRSTQVMSLSANVRSDAGSASTNSSMRAGLDVPAITIQGCSVNQRTVADLITRLEALRRVSRVSLETSERQGANASSGCTVDVAEPYSFTLVVFYAPGSSAPGAEAGGAGAEAVTPTEQAGTTTTAAGN